MRPLTGDGVRLEPQTTEHAAELFAVIADPALYEFIDDGPPASESGLRARLARLESRLSPDATEHWLNWIVRNDAGALVGYVQATIRAGNTAEIAYVFGREYWRRGYACAACRAMIGELAARYGVSRIEATLDPANRASLALLYKLGLGLAWENAAAREVGYALDLGGKEPPCSPSPP